MKYMDSLKPSLTCFTVVVYLCLFSACDGLVSSGNGDSSQDDNLPQPPSSISNNKLITVKSFLSTAPYSGETVRKISGSGEQTLTLTGLDKHSLFLVTVNTSANSVSAEKLGSVLSYKSENTVTEPDTATVQSLKSTADTVDITGTVSGIFTGNDGQRVTRHEKEEKNREIMDAIRDGRLGPPAPSSGDGRVLRSVLAGTSLSVGDSRQFWVQDETFYKVEAKLRATGTYSNVWVANANFIATGHNNSTSSNDGNITTDQAQTLANKFDEIYIKETPVFGFEYGGGVGSSDLSYGGADSDPKIHILVYDIDKDYYPSQTGGVFGYFFSGDEYSEAELSSLGHGNYKTNQAEIFYIDAHFTDSRPNLMYSTLAHEFQHMINFNQKTIKSGYNTVAGVWYNEMLSMLAEDLIDPLIGIPATDQAHPIQCRIPDFLAYYYYEDPTVWLNNTNTVLHSYANAYALGAYLVRNFGGAALVKEIMSGTLVDTASLNAALASSVNPLKDSVSSFTAALKRYGEAMLFNQPDDDSRPVGVLSFNNTVTKSIGGMNYTFSGFDVWQMSGENKKMYGPYVYDTNTTRSLRPRTMLLQSNDNWQNITGSRTITLRPPTVSGVELYIMVR
ncbi:MAG: hypothetical protein LBD44_06590 [Spirochaetaceae bacterium]|jgi:hypothetical protein|nr:hypothetical protein [Spirochaetaceae bacterium]